MIDRHGEAQELLAGYALQSLSGEDAAGADRLLVDNQTPQVLGAWAERARGLRIISSAVGTSGFFVSSDTFRLQPHTQRGARGGQIQSRLHLRNAVFTNRSSRE